MRDEKNSEDANDNSKLTPGGGFLPKPSELSQIKWYIWWLFALVVACNIIAIIVYVSQQDLFNYFDSKSYEALLAILLIPLLLSLIAQAFKVGEKLDADRRQLAQDIKEAKRQVEEAKRKRQTDTIEKTNALWRELYSLSTEVAYFKAGQSKATIRDIRKRLECLANSAEEMLNLWFLNFPEIALEIQEHALPGLNLLLLSALTIADVVEDESEADAKQMQNCLLVIQDGIRYGLHYPLMQIFYFEMEKKELELTSKIAGLSSWGGVFQDLIKDQCPNFPPDDAAKASKKAREEYLADYQEKCAKPKAKLDELAEAAEAAAPDKREAILNSAEFLAAVAAYNQAEEATIDKASDYFRALAACPPNLLGLTRKRIFSTDQLKNFTAQMFFQADVSRMKASV